MLGWRVGPLPPSLSLCFLVSSSSQRDKQTKTQDRQPDKRWARAAEVATLCVGCRHRCRYRRRRCRWWIPTFDALTAGWGTKFLCLLAVNIATYNRTVPYHATLLLPKDVSYMPCHAMLCRDKSHYTYNPLPKYFVLLWRRR